MAPAAVFVARAAVGAAWIAEPPALPEVSAASSRCAVALTAESASCEGDCLTALPNAAAPLGSHIAPLRRAAAPGDVTVIAIWCLVSS